MVRILAVDYGERRVGLALSDETGSVAAQALPTVDRRAIRPPGTLEQEIGRLADGREVSEIVVGLPVNMDGSHGEAAERVARFAGNLARITGLPVHTWDERLTTVVAKRVQVELNLPRGKRRQKDRLDRTAALLLLQNYLEFRRNTARRDTPEGPGA
ncbi:MAG: Holliday junction resolvase RuvX [Candidatus Glassbacteria bacterium]